MSGVPIPLWERVAAYGTGARIKLVVTRAIIDGDLYSGAPHDAPYDHRSVFRSPGHHSVSQAFSQKMLIPTVSTWADHPERYERRRPPKDRRTLANNFRTLRSRPAEPEVAPAPDPPPETSGKTRGVDFYAARPRRVICPQPDVLCRAIRTVYVDGLVRLDPARTLTPEFGARRQSLDQSPTPSLPRNPPFPLETRGIASSLLYPEVESYLSDRMIVRPLFGAIVMALIRQDLRIPRRSLSSHHGQTHRQARLPRIATAAETTPGDDPPALEFRGLAHLLLCLFPWRFFHVSNLKWGDAFGLFRDFTIPSAFPPRGALFFLIFLVVLWIGSYFDFDLLQSILG